jgi:hypothetical protein
MNKELSQDKYQKIAQPATVVDFSRKIFLKRLAGKVYHHSTGYRNDIPKL